MNRMTHLLGHPLSHGHLHGPLFRWLVGSVALVLLAVAVVSLMLARTGGRSPVHVDLDVEAPPLPASVAAPAPLAPLPEAAPVVRVQGPPLIIRATAPRHRPAVAR
jgi:hypothetical protein